MEAEKDVEHVAVGVNVDEADKLEEKEEETVVLPDTVCVGVEEKEVLGE